MTADLGDLLRRALLAEAARVRPSPDALNLIRARTAGRSSRLRILLNHLTPRSKENP